MSESEKYIPPTPPQSEEYLRNQEAAARMWGLKPAPPPAPKKE